MNTRQLDHCCMPQTPSTGDHDRPAEASAHLYRAMLDTLPFPVWVKNEESRLLAVNQAFADIFNVTNAQSLVGKTDFDIVPAPLAEAYRADDRQVLSQGRSKIIEERIPEHGSDKWFETFKAPISGADGTIIGTVGFAKDISERKQGEHRQSEQLIDLRLHHNALAAISQGVVITDAKKRICYVNPGFEQMTGYRLAEIAGNSCRFLQGAESDQGTLRQIRLAINDGKPVHGEIRNYRKDGSPFWNRFSIVPITDLHGSITQFVGVLSDISASKQADEQLLNYAREVEDLYQNAPCGYHSVNRAGLFVRINNTELSWLGYDRNEVVGQPLVRFLAPNSIPAFETYFAQLVDKLESATTEVDFIRKDGSYLPVLISATALCDEYGNFAVSRASVSDLREHRKAEAERAQQAAKLEAMSRHLVATQEDIRRRLSADLHDRTSPNLAAISINLGILATELASRDSAEITARVEDTRALIEDTAASIREISSELRPQLLDYAGLLPAIENHGEEFSRRTGIKLDILCTNRQLRPSREHEPILFRIFKEALTNCAKHSQATQVEIALTQTRNAIEMLIADNGIGINPHQQKPDKPNGGLGLINMREAAEFAGGTFSVDSQPGKGTRIHVRI